MFTVVILFVVQIWCSRQTVPLYTGYLEVYV